MNQPRSISLFGQYDGEIDMQLFIYTIYLLHIAQVFV